MLRYEDPRGSYLEGRMHARLSRVSKRRDPRPQALENLALGARVLYHTSLH